MALRFLDSFDHYTTPSQKYGFAADAPTIVAAAARHGIAGMRFDAVNGNHANAVGIELGQQQQWVMGFYVRFNAFPGTISDFVSINDAALATQGNARINSTGNIVLTCAGAPGGVTSANRFLLHVWYYVEFKLFVDNVVGLWQARVNGVQWVTFSGDTQSNIHAYATRLYVGTQQNTWNLDIDDYYILDGTGLAPNNDYWGFTDVSALMPSEGGFYTQFATVFGAAFHFLAVNEIPPNEDASYVDDGTAGHKDSYTMQDLPNTAAIKGVQVLHRGKVAGGGAINFQRLYRRAATDNLGGVTALAAAYAYYREIMETDPIAAAPWTVANINAAEFGQAVA